MTEFHRLNLEVLRSLESLRMFLNLKNIERN
nr:MAG TPA: hypothetical protein [Bacteriophage sp.]